MKTTFSLTQWSMDDLLLLVHGIMKICLVVGVMVLVATWPTTSSAAKAHSSANGHLVTSILAWSAANHNVSNAEGVADRQGDFGCQSRWRTCSQALAGRRRRLVRQIF